MLVSDGKVCFITVHKYLTHRDKGDVFVESSGQDEEFEAHVS